MKRLAATVAIILILLPAAALAQPTVADLEVLIDSLIDAMTVEEKLGQLTQYRGEWGTTGPVAQAGGEDQIRAGHAGSFLSMYGAEYTRKLQKIAVEESRMGIPLLFAQDVIHGFRTTFPVPIAEAGTFDPAAIEHAARIAAIEASAAGVHWTFAPMVDIARDPRWGRIVEGSGEDPYLGSVMAVAKVRGFQGSDLTASNTLLATAKHFVAYGGAEGGRDYNTVDISERTLREIYLPPFRAAVDAGVGSVMGAFNEIGGIPLHAHEYLINGLLRGEWGWDGIFVSDYTGILELIPHGVAANRTEAGVLGIKAGVDVDMVSEIYLKDLPAAVEDGRVDIALVNQAVRRVLDAKYKLGLFDDPYRYSDPEREKALLLHPDHIAASRDVARKAIVLLKNEGQTLPLSKDLKKIAVIGPLADHARATLGGWSSPGRAEDAVAILPGIRNAVSDSTEVVFAKGSEIEDRDMSGFEEAVAAADDADAVVLVLGEHHDMSAEALNRTDIGLPGVQRELAEVIISLGKPTVVVLMNGRPLAIPWLADHAPAILETWFLGVQMGNAVADVIFGDYNPGGKLPASFPVNVGQIPLYYNHKNTGRPPSPTDKYTSKYMDAPWTPLYPFGYGLSYTTFTFTDVTVTPDKSPLSENSPITVSATITNTGDRTGDEVVQVYIQDVTASVTRPVKELKRFQRITLEPGASRTLTFTLTQDDLEFYGLDMIPTVEHGLFKVFVGSSSVDVTEVQFELTNE
ncbi:MAG TPA: beta-glucosidase BglX [Rhodothermales bacterium]|nr:beta-glucosidase BglX [Rhodothermales bacterium]